MSKPSKQESAQALQDFKEILDQLKVRFFLDGGTALGAYREKDFCEDDQDDIDLTTLGDDKMLDIVELAGTKGFTAYKAWKKKGQTTSQIAMKRNGVKIDLMFKEIKKKEAWWTVYKRDGVVYKSLNKKHYKKRGKPPQVNFYGETYNLPYDIEEYLFTRYGNWQTPVHRSKYSCYTSDQCIKENYETIQ